MMWLWIGRSESGRKGMEAVADGEKNGKPVPTTARWRARLLSSSSDEDEIEADDQQVNKVMEWWFNSWAYYLRQVMWYPTFICLFICLLVC